jgi:hypothetical protein
MTLLACLAAGLLTGVAYTASPLTVIWAAGTGIFLSRAGRDLPAIERRRLVAILIAALGLRIAIVIGLMVANVGDSQSAGLLFGDEGYLWRRMWRLRDAWLGLAGAPYDYINAFEDYARTGYLYGIAYLEVLFGPFSYGLRLVNASVFLGAMYVLYRLARRSYGVAPAMIGLSVLLFVPSLLSWSVSLLKEAAYILATVGALTLAVAAIRSSDVRGRFANALGSVACIALIWPLRPQGVAIMAAGLAAGLGLWWATARFRRGWLIAVLTPLLVWAALQVPRVQAPVIGVLQVAAREHAGHVFTVGHAYKTLDAHLYRIPTFQAWTLAPDEAGRFVARSAAAFVLVPLPWHVTSGSELLYLPEQMTWYLLVALAMLGVVPSFRRDALVTCLLLGCVLTASAAVALVSGNVGTLIRHRSLSLPFMVWFSAVGGMWLIDRMVERTRSTREACVP